MGHIRFGACIVLFSLAFAMSLGIAKDVEMDSLLAKIWGGQPSGANTESGVRSNGEVFAVFRPAWSAWKKEMRKHHADSVLSGHGGVRFLIDSSGKIIEARMDPAATFNPMVQSEVLKMFAGLQFKQTHSPAIDTLTVLLKIVDK